jgi:hypothetical protein
MKEFCVSERAPVGYTKIGVNKITIEKYLYILELFFNINSNFRMLSAPFRVL